MEIAGEFDVACEISDCAERRADENRGEYRKPVQPVRQVNRIAKANNKEVADHDVEHSEI